MIKMQELSVEAEALMNDKLYRQITNNNDLHNHRKYPPKFKLSAYNYEIFLGVVDELMTFYDEYPEFFDVIDTEKLKAYILEQPTLYDSIKTFFHISLFLTHEINSMIFREKYTIEKHGQENFEAYAHRFFKGYSRNLVGSTYLKEQK